MQGAGSRHSRSSVLSCLFFSFLQSLASVRTKRYLGRGGRTRQPGHLRCHTRRETEAGDPWAMWHDTMLASCNPAWDFSHSCITVNAQTTGSLKLSGCLKPNLELKRARAVPSVVHGGSICSDYRNDDLGQLTHRGRIVLVSKSRTMSPRVGRGVGVSVPAQKSRPVVMASRGTGSSLSVTMTAVVTKDADISGHASGDAGMPVYNLAEREQDISIAESEKLRRHRISIANKGKVPWNKGCKHSAGVLFTVLSPELCIMSFCRGFDLYIPPGGCLVSKRILSSCRIYRRP